jgi:hypothetical protein
MSGFERGPGMIWNLDTAWLLMAIATVVVLSFFFGAALDYLMRDDGFGSTGNMIIVSVGFFLGIVAVNQQGYDLHELHRAVMVGLAGAFVCLALMTLLKGMIARFLTD